MVISYCVGDIKRTIANLFNAATLNNLKVVMAGPVPAIPIGKADRP
jgi:hypothetical protein